MIDFRFVKGAAVSLATFGMMMPQASLLADSSPRKVTAAKTSTVSRIPDLVLTDGGTMSGRVCDHSGKVLEGAKVILKQDNKVIATTETNSEGVYAFSNLKGGIYHPVSGKTEGVFRVWTEDTAPPTAKEHALLVIGENGARGQFGSVDPTLILLTAGVLTSVVLGAVAIDKTNKVSKQISDLPRSP